MSAPPAHVAWREVIGGGHGLAAGVVVLAILTPALNTFITATMLPSVVADIGGLALYAWATVAYSVASIVGGTASSAVARGMGLRAALVVAGGIFVVGTAACALAPAMIVVVAGRAVQGVGGGMIIGVVHGVVREVFPERLWPRLLATISVAWGVAALAGPLVGGLFAQLGSWRGGFWVMVALVLVTCSMALRLLPARRRARARPETFPLDRLLLICAAVLSLASVANAPGGVSRVVLLLTAAGLVAAALALDARAAARLFPSGMLSLRRPVGQCFWIIFLIAIATTPFGVFGPLLIQVLHGLSPVGAGYLFALHSLAWTCAAVLTSRLAGDRVRTAVVGGPVLMTAGLAGLFFLMEPGPVVAIAAAVIVEGLGIGACWPHIGNVMLGSARANEEEATAALIPNTQQFAWAFGGALCAIIASGVGLTREASPPVVAAASRALFGVFTVGALAAAVVAGRLTRRLR